MRTTKSRQGWITPIRPNWRKAVQQELNFLTDVIVSRSEQEQRFSLRQTPRIEYQFDATITGARLDRFRADIYQRQVEPFWFPLDWRQAQITTGALAGTDGFSVASPPFWLVVGARVVIQTDTTEELAEVETIAGAVVTLVDALTYDAPTGATIREARQVRLPDDIQFRQLTSSIWETTVRLSEVPAANTFTFPEVTPDVFFDTEVFLEKPDWSTTPTMTIGQTRETFDPTVGADFVWTPTDFSRIDIESSHFERSRLSSEELIGFFARCYGRRKPFWSPTWTKDVTVVSAAGSSVVVQGLDSVTGYAALNVMKYMIAFWPDGSHQINEVVTLTASGADATELGFAGAWDNTVDNSTRLHWLPLRRLSADKITVDWWTTTLAKVKLSTTTLKTEEVDS